MWPCRAFQVTLQVTAVLKARSGHLVQIVLTVSTTRRDRSRHHGQTTSHDALRRASDVNIYLFHAVDIAEVYLYITKRSKEFFLIYFYQIQNIKHL